MGETYTVNLPSYTIGPDAYQSLPYQMRRFGKRAVAIGGRTALEKARPYLEKALKMSDVTITDFIWYGGNATYENGEALIAQPAVQMADVVLAVGGGRACDMVKYVADRLDKPLMTLPTVASNCAAVTAVCVMYHADGSFFNYYYPKLAEHCFIQSDIIADSPEPLLWAGIGDALSKECEAAFSSMDDKLSHTPLLGRQISRICTEPLLEYGAEALASIRKHQASEALEQVTLDIIVSTGIVSNLMTTPDSYYYNSTLAHCIYYGATATQNGHRHLHGEIVALGVLCLEWYAGHIEQGERLMQFNASVGLPVCFDDIEIEEDEFEGMADTFTQTREWKHRPQCVTRERLLKVMREVNAEGRRFKRQRDGLSER